MKNKLINIKNEALAMIMGASDADELERIRINYLGKNGILTQITKDFKDLNIEEKADIGRIFSEAKVAIAEAIAFKSQIKIQNQKYRRIVARQLPPIGHLHPVTQAIEEISNIFEKIGFVQYAIPK